MDLVNTKDLNRESKYVRCIASVIMIVLMTLSAIVGIGIVRYIPLPMVLQVAIGLCFTAVALVISKTTLVPMISACILPIYLGTTSVIYPISVCIMALIIVLVKRFFESRDYLEQVAYQPVGGGLKKGLLYYGKRLLVFLVLAAVPILFGKLYLVAPPLIVTFVEFSNEKSRMRKNDKKIILVIMVAALIGMLSRIFLVEMLGLSLTIATFVIVCLVLLTFSVYDVAFPPAGAIAMLPLILKPDGLIYYPVYVFIGALLLIKAAMFCFNSERNAKIVK